MRGMRLAVAATVVWQWDQWDYSWDYTYEIRKTYY